MFVNYFILLLLIINNISYIYCIVLNTKQQHKVFNNINFFATTITGLEHILAAEIKQLPYTSKITIGKGSVSFQGINYNL